MTVELEMEKHEAKLLAHLNYLKKENYNLTQSLATQKHINASLLKILERLSFELQEGFSDLQEWIQLRPHLDS